VPEWAKGVVWYQVFPERFANGNTGNDPYRWDRTVLAWDHRFDATSHEEIEMHWNRRIVDPRRFSGDPDRWWGAAGQAVFERRYGGDLQGVVDRLDDLRELGVTGLYLCPVFDAQSLHKYEASDYRHIDPTLGHPGMPTDTDRSLEDPLDEGTWGWEPADRYVVDVLLPQARARGMRVILDGVWNHVGREHFAFQDVLENGVHSRYADWFKAEFDREGRLLSYDAWDRPNGALPEFRQTPEGDLAPGPKAHIFAVTRRWMDPNGDGDPRDGVDGWRLDVAPEIGRAFWRDWRAQVRSINPDAVLVGEIWSDAERWFNGVAFDAQMNYPLAYALADWLAIDRDGTDAASCVERIRAVTNHAPDHELAQMNLIASHDTERGVSLMMNGTDRSFDQGAEPWREAYRRGSGDQDAKERLLAAYALLVALPGSPMIYNGDEWALPGADDPDNRRPIHWPGLAPTPDQPDPGFREVLGGLLLLRSHAELGEVLRLGGAHVSVGADGESIRVRRMLDQSAVEFVVWRSGDMVGEYGPDSGWSGVGLPNGLRMAAWRFISPSSAP
jgi:cyclomaltodextrinase / maltogenic alpha-amylase / neopullulanase